MTLEQQIEELRARVSRLEAQVGALQAQNGQGVREAPASASMPTSTRLIEDV